MAGDGHNNVVCQTPETLHTAMAICNGMTGKIQKMEKTINSLQKDFKQLNQKPAFSFWTGHRTRLHEEVEVNKKTKEKKSRTFQVEDYGLVCVQKQLGNVFIRNVLLDDTSALITE